VTDENLADSGAEQLLLNVIDLNLSP